MSNREVVALHMDDYIRGFDDISEGVRAFDSLLSMANMMSVEDLIKHGCEDHWFDDANQQPLGVRSKR